ncbi:hypothetical protein [Paraburkholderia dipogonis]|uniref:hypothetical protein n=1 Tax=Paraburkholderia dipogonis TaxID=1211383 RepID=UPI0038BB45DD
MQRMQRGEAGLRGAPTVAMPPPNEPCPPALSATDEAELDPHDALFAHLTGLCSGALIIVGTTAVVCAVARCL